MKKYFVFLLCMVALVFTLLGCSQEEKPSDDTQASATSLPEQTPSPSPAATSEGVKTTPEIPSPLPSLPEPEMKIPRNPLTGMPMEEDEIGNRPVAVMLNNLKAALPQQGNGQADIIYEVVTEGGITRMLAVYQSVEGIERIASVRSARTGFVEMALGHDAVFIHAGGSEDAYTNLDEWDVDHLDGVRGIYSYPDNGLFWRERERIEGKKFALEHSLVTSGEAILRTLDKSGLRLEHVEDYAYEMKFAENGTPTNGEEAIKIQVPFSRKKTGVFLYDKEAGVYQAEQYGEPYLDGNSGEQISVTNVLILQTTIRETGDSYGHTDADLAGGKGWFACGGKIVPITWEKGGRDAQFRYFAGDGKELVLGRGKSYVNIISKDNQVTYE